MTRPPGSPGAALGQCGKAKPTLIACKTRIGKGSATLEGHHDTHGKALGKAEEIAATREKLGWPHDALRHTPMPMA